MLASLRSPFITGCCIVAKTTQARETALAPSAFSSAPATRVLCVRRGTAFFAILKPTIGPTDCRCDAEASEVLQCLNGDDAVASDDLRARARGWTSGRYFLLLSPHRCQANKRCHCSPFEPLRHLLLRGRRDQYELGTAGNGCEQRCTRHDAT